MDLLDHMHRTAFLGTEFLTWLWYHSQLDDGEFRLNRDVEFGPFELWFEDKLVVSAVAINAMENLFKGGQPADSLEARTALRLGKMASEAKLRIVRGAQEWAFTFKAQGLVMASVRIPAVLSKEDDDRFYERMFLTEQLDHMMKGLFGQFLELRLSAAWATTELPALQRWTAGAGAEA